MLVTFIVKPGCMLHCIYVHKSLHAFWTCLYCPRCYGLAPLKCDLSVLVRIQAASSVFTQTEDSSTCRQPKRAASARRSQACLPCACSQPTLWTSTCLCLIALLKTAWTHILRASYFADIGVPLAQPPISALRVLCLRSWPAIWTVSLSLTVMT